MRSKNLHMTRSYPNATVGRGSQRLDSVLGQSFALGNAFHTKVAKHIEPPRCGDPNVSFAIFKDAQYKVARQTLLTAIVIHIHVMDSVKAASCPDPKVLLTIAAKGYHFQSLAIQLWCNKRFQTAIYHSLQSGASGGYPYPDPERAIGRRRERHDAAVSLVGSQRLRSVNFRPSRPPSDKCCRASQPKVARSVLHNRATALGRDSIVLSVATNPVIDDLAKWMEIVVGSMMVEPDFSLSVFHDVRDPPSLAFLVQRQSVVNEVSQSGIGSDPQAPISNAEQSHDALGRQIFCGSAAPTNKTHTIELVQSCLSSHPNVAVGGLRDVKCPAAEISVLHTPNTVTILRDLTCGVEREDAACKTDKENCKECNCTRSDRVQRLFA